MKRFLKILDLIVLYSEYGEVVKRQNTNYKHSCELFLSFRFPIFNRLLEVVDTISHTLDLETQSSMQFLRENILMNVFDITSMSSPVIGIQIEAGKAQSLTTSNIQNLMADTNITVGKVDAAIILPVELINSEFYFISLFDISASFTVALWIMAFNATFNNISVISWRSVLLVEETGGPGENQRPVASH